MLTNYGIFESYILIAMRSRATKKRIVRLKWKALPVYEKLVYSKDLCKERNLTLQDQLKAFRWEQKRNKTFAFILLILSVLVLIHPAGTWNAALFLLISGAFMLLIEETQMKRFKRLKKAAKLRKDLVGANPSH